MSIKKIVVESYEVSPSRDNDNVTIDLVMSDYKGSQYCTYHFNDEIPCEDWEIVKMIIDNYEGVIPVEDARILWDTLAKYIVPISTSEQVTTLW